MRNSKRTLRRCLGLLLGMCLVFFVGIPAQAFAPSTSPLLSAAAVTPNVMLLVDDSGSMNSIIWASGFDSTATPSQIYICASDSNCLFGQALDMTDTSIFISDLNRGGCSSGWYGFYRGLLGLASICLKLPDPVGSGNTRYSAAYLAYLVNLANGKNTDFTTGTIPTDYRINVARTVSAALVAANRNLRFGLATFNSPTNADRGPGGYIARSISDLQAVSGSTTTAQATTNYNNLVSSINALAAVANTPLAETYYEITRYMRGMAPYYNSSPTTYTSPIQYRCQKNFGVVITDGLPTYDRTFPTNDPLGGKNLPNWDGINNDGANLSGDSEGDTLYLDDIAKFAYDIDMRAASTTSTDAAGKSWDAADFPKQNMLTYTVGFTSSNQMLSDAASYGHGKYYQASDSTSLTAALSSALSDITSKAGSGGAGATNSSTLTSSTVYYQTLYDPADWRGVINAYAISTAGVISSTASWTTNTTMAVGTTAPTFESYNTSTALPITMNYANYSSAQQAVLTASVPSGVTATSLVNWAKGTNVTGLRTRTVLMGDIINSPLTLAAATDQTASDLTNDSTYTSFLAIKSANMTPRLLVNANDGFFNVLNANTGVRDYAYMPSTALPSLEKVADTTYVNGTSHTFLNDGQIAVFDAQISSAWKTIALTGTGGGGKAYTAVQIFDAATKSSTPKALWELRPDTATTFANLGYAYSKPEVARLPDGTWAAFIANGYGSTKGVASLFVVNLATGALIKEIVAESSNGSNGLSSVKLKVNASNVVQAAYGGDLLGHMWKFDLSSTSTASWAVAFSGSPLFTAPGGATQPITAQPLLVTNSTSGKMVYFGTGKLLETTDKTTTDSEAFYAVWDADNATGNYTVSNLQAQAVTGTYTSGSSQYLTTTSNVTDYTSQKGWYIPLVYGTLLTGNRVIYQAAYTSGRVIFTTADIDTTDPCSSQGSGYIIELDALNGSLLSYPVLDTNGDGSVNASDTRVSGLYISTGIPDLNAIVSVAATSTTAASQRKIVNDSSGTLTVLVEAAGSVTTASRIMWRQIQ
ncbi:pilus assembly protein [Pseudomonas eucalypticola]|uniref:Pilus assembly protein n=2 Tax=Pseudomonas TaxID=286 RepID=A0A7D5H8H8_9PSED|nr:PilC/PilY family type IV pilus protein [Pseudomonas eucalypticola]QKZ06809.1 pilus assembly protein [Pseudomonas eucalypticola]